MNEIHGFMVAEIAVLATYVPLKDQFTHGEAFFPSVYDCPIAPLIQPYLFR